MPARDLGLYGAFKVTRFLIGKLEQFIEIANLRRGVSGYGNLDGSQDLK